MGKNVKIKLWYLVPVRIISPMGYWYKVNQSPNRTKPTTCNILLPWNGGLFRFRLTIHESTCQKPGDSIVSWVLLL